MLHELQQSSSLMTDFCAGDATAFKRIYELYHAKVYRFAFSFLKDKEQSQEILQETFIKLWISRERYVVTEQLEPYLFTICKRLVLDHFRLMTKNNSLRADLMRKISSIHNETEEAILCAEVVTFAENSILKLPPQQQLIFRLSRFEGLSHAEIAERLHISQHTVKNHLVLALKSLRADFSKADIYASSLLFILSCV